MNGLDRVRELHSKTARSLTSLRRNVDTSMSVIVQSRPASLYYAERSFQVVCTAVDFEILRLLTRQDRYLLGSGNMSSAIVSFQSCQFAAFLEAHVVGYSLKLECIV